MKNDNKVIINLKVLWTVVKKELINIVRDKKTLIISLIPIIVIPSLIVIVGKSFASEPLSISDIPVGVSIVGEKEYIDKLNALDFLNSIGLKNIMYDIDDGTNLLTEEVIDLNIEFFYKSSDSLLSINIFFNGDSEESAYAANLVYDQINKYIIYVQSLKLEALDVNSTLDYNVNIIENNEGNTSTIFVILPMLIISILFTSGINISVDIFSGEKERGTLVEVLVTQVNRYILIIGKLISVFIFVCLEAFLTIGSVLLATRIFSNQLSGMIDPQDTRMSISQAVNIFIILIILVLIVSSVLTLLCITSKSTKEAQTKCTMLFMLSMLICVATMFFKINSDSILISLIPIINCLVNMNLFMSNHDINTISYFAFILSSLLFSVGCVFYSVIYLNEISVKEIISSKKINMLSLRIKKKGSSFISRITSYYQSFTKYIKKK